MQTLIVKIDTADHAMQVANFLKTVPYIKSVVTEKQSKKTSTIDWALPGRTATNQETEEMLDESEQGVAISAEKSKAENFKKFKEWQKKSLK